MAKRRKTKKKSKMSRDMSRDSHVTSDIPAASELPIWHECPNPHCSRLRECQDLDDCAAGPQEAAVAPPIIEPTAQESGVPPPKKPRKRAESRPGNAIAAHTPQAIDNALPAEILEPLNDKQEIFVREFLVDLNATQAAIRSGYSVRSAREIGFENLRKPNIALAVDTALAALGGITRARIVEELGAIAFSDLGELVRWSEYVVDLDEGTEYEINGEKQVAEKGMKTRVVRQRVEIIPSDQLAPSQRRLISEVSQDARGGIKVKLWDKTAALDKLARALGMYVEKEDGSHTTNNVNLTAVTIYEGRPNTRPTPGPITSEAMGGAGNAGD